MYRMLAAAILAGIAAAPLAAQSPCTRNLESGFSYCVPEGWTVKTNLNDKFKLFLGPASTAFTPNLNVKDEENALSLDDDVAANIKNMTGAPEKAGATVVRLVGQSEFVTTSGQRGVRLVFHVETATQKVRALQYYFAARGNQKLVISGLASEAGGTSLDVIFDRAMSSLQIDNK